MLRGVTRVPRICLLAAVIAVAAAGGGGGAAPAEPVASTARPQAGGAASDP